MSPGAASQHKHEKRSYSFCCFQLFLFLCNNKPRFWKFSFLFYFCFVLFSVIFKTKTNNETSRSLVGRFRFLRSRTDFFSRFVGAVVHYQGLILQLEGYNFEFVLCGIVLMEPRVGNKFRLGRKIGSGSFGEIYLGLLYIFQCNLLAFFLFFGDFF